MIYLDELPDKNHKGGIETIMENCTWDYNYGYRQFKIKIGRGKNWYPAKEGMEMDIKIVKMIYETYKNKGVDILVDSNNSYTLEDTITFLKGIEDIPLYWVEEPFLENVETGRKLRKWMNENGFAKTLYADGEWVNAEAKEDVALDMVDAGIVNTCLRIYQLDESNATIKENKCRGKSACLGNNAKNTLCCTFGCRIGKHTYYRRSYMYV
jgi:D-galactarolactone cycloisomerase